MVVSEGIFIGGVIFVYPEIVTVKHIQSVFCSHPKITQMILIN